MVANDEIFTVTYQHVEGGPVHVRTFTEQRKADRLLTDIDNDPFLELRTAEGWTD